MALTAKKIAFCVLQLVQVDTVNDKKVPFVDHGATNLQTTCIKQNPYVTTKKLRTLTLKFSVMYHLNKNVLRSEY